MAVQYPLLPLLERLAPEPGLVAHFDAVTRDDEREDGDALRLREPAPNAPARPAAEGEESVARVWPEEALGLEGVRVGPVARCMIYARQPEE